LITILLLLPVFGPRPGNESKGRLALWAGSDQEDPRKPTPTTPVRDEGEVRWSDWAQYWSSPA